ncbi:MAG: hotdog fold domain-containing protein [Usitatibacteraceae bacterium]
MPDIMSLWQKLSDKPMGKWLFGKAVCHVTPYFATIKPRFEEFKPGYTRVSMKKRRPVENHIHTVHAIAVCNLAECGAGTLMEASLPRSMRWLPKGMNVQYLKKSETDLVAECTASDLDEGPARDVVVNVDVKDTRGNIVVHADITMYVSPRPTKG